MIKEFFKYFVTYKAKDDITTCPNSATSGWTSSVGVLTFIGMSYLLVTFKSEFQYYTGAPVFILLCTTLLAMVAVDLCIFKVHRKPSTGLNFAIDAPSWERTGIKLLGLIGTFLFLGIIYWVWPEYNHSRYDNYFVLVKGISSILVLLAIPYFYYIDRHMINPYDGYWQMGNLLLCKWENIEIPVLRQHLLGWWIKGFFLTLMYMYSVNGTNNLLRYEPSLNFGHLYVGAIMFLYFMDVSFATISYTFSFRIFDNHIRSAESTMYGWVVALICYQPFSAFLNINIRDNLHLYFDKLSMSYAVLCSIAVVLTAIYVWATVVFGLRSSNLTNRGIITNGPYSLTKHPAYISKNLSWWLISVPFMHSGFTSALKLSVLLLMVNLIYTLRARTEERHLSKDPDYVEYALWIDKHGLFSFLNKVPFFKNFRYKPPVVA